jgi:hypothetical protein
VDTQTRNTSLRQANGSLERQPQIHAAADHHFEGSHEFLALLDDIALEHESQARIKFEQPAVEKGCCGIRNRLDVSERGLHKLNLYEVHRFLL